MSQISDSTQGKGIRQYFRTTGGNISANYDFYDAAAGLGYKTFYAGKYADYAGGTDTWFLTTFPVGVSTSAVKTGVSAAAGDTTFIFDYTFTNPMTVASGDCFVEETMTNGGSASDVYIEAKLYHVNLAATETLLGSEKSFSQENVNVAKHLLQRFTVTGKSFGVGEKLRLKVIVNTSDASSYLNHDPSGRVSYTEDTTAGTVDSTLKCIVPFRISI